MLKTDICIVGAGPGGAATALKLSHLGIPCVLVDKAEFPRDKVCGDAISGKAALVLQRIDPAIMERFEAASEMQVDIWGMRFVAPNNKAVDIPFKTGFDKLGDQKPGFVSKRIDFDNFLIHEVKRRENIDLHLGISIENIEKTPGGFRVQDKAGKFDLECRLLIVANGANSQFARQYAGLEKDDRHHAGAVRAYYRNVTGFHPDRFIELHFLDEITPGYFWIFPLPNGYANVGLGMRTDQLSARKYNLTKSLPEVIANHPHLRERFRNAELAGKISGYGLPLGSKFRPISGDHFMLVGDAGHLIDPLTGEGIGNGIYSGFIAAEQAKLCLESGDFSARFMKAYDVRVKRVLGEELKISYRLQQLMNRPWLVNFLASRVANNRALIERISLMYNDMEVRKRALNPLAWLKLLVRR